jgi:hypothetical protein
LAASLGWLPFDLELLAVAAVLALAIGVVLRRSVAAVTAAIVVIVLPYVLATASVSCPQDYRS